MKKKSLQGHRFGNVFSKSKQCIVIERVQCCHIDFLSTKGVLLQLSIDPNIP